MNSKTYNMPFGDGDLLLYVTLGAKKASEVWTKSANEFGEVKPPIVDQQTIENEKSSKDKDDKKDEDKKKSKKKDDDEKMGPVKAMAAARATGPAAKYQASQLAAKNYSEEGMPLRGMWSRMVGGHAGGEVLRGGTHYASPTMRLAHTLPIVGDEIGGILDPFTTFGDPSNVEKAQKGYDKHIAKYQSGKDVKPASKKDLEHALDVTPRTILNAGDVVDLDHQIAAHTANRKERPMHYWLNPLIRTGPFSEINARVFRRGAAEKADPDNWFRQSLYIPGVPSLRGILSAKNDARKDKARALIGAVQNELNKTNMRRSPNVSTDATIPISAALDASAAGIDAADKFAYVKKSDNKFWGNVFSGNWSDAGTELKGQMGLDANQQADTFTQRVRDNLKGTPASWFLGGDKSTADGKPSGNILDNNWANLAMWGAPIGAGLGLVGGLTSRKKKKNLLGDAMWGGLLGLGAGGLVGGAYDLYKNLGDKGDAPKQQNPNDRPPPNLDPTKGPLTSLPSKNPGVLDRGQTLFTDATDTVNQIKQKFMMQKVPEATSKIYQGLLASGRVQEAQDIKAKWDDFNAVKSQSNPEYIDKFVKLMESLNRVESDVKPKYDTTPNMALGGGTLSAAKQDTGKLVDARNVFMYNRGPDAKGENQWAFSGKDPNDQPIKYKTYVPAAGRDMEVPLTIQGLSEDFKAPSWVTDAAMRSSGQTLGSAIDDSSPLLQETRDYIVQNPQTILQADDPTLFGFGRTPAGRSILEGAGLGAFSGMASRAIGNKLLWAGSGYDEKIYRDMANHALKLRSNTSVVDPNASAVTKVVKPGEGGGLFKSVGKLLKRPQDLVWGDRSLQVVPSFKDTITLADDRAFVQRLYNAYLADRTSRGITPHATIDDFIKALKKQPSSVTDDTLNKALQLLSKGYGKSITNPSKLVNEDLTLGARAANRLTGSIKPMLTFGALGGLSHFTHQPGTAPLYTGAITGGRDIYGGNKINLTEDQVAKAFSNYITATRQDPKSDDAWNAFVHYLRKNNVKLPDKWNGPGPTPP